jgi:hypothetical protein
MVAALVQGRPEKKITIMFIRRPIDKALNDLTVDPGSVDLLFVGQ